MDVNYGSRAPFTLGVEEELQLLSPESCELVELAQPAAVRLGCAHELALVEPLLVRGTAPPSSGPPTTLLGAARSGLLAAWSS